MPLGTIAFLAMAAALGAGSGATFALVAQLAPPAKVGSVTGLVGAAGGLGGFVPPLVMGYVYGRTGSYAIGLALLAVVSAADPAADADRGAHRYAAAAPPDRCPRASRHRARRRRGPLMCEYCGCQQIAVIKELTREHEAVVTAIGEVRRALDAGSVGAAAQACRRMTALLGPHTVVEEEGLFPFMAPEFPAHVDALRAEHRSIDAVLREAADGTPEDPTWPDRLLRALHELREHILKEQDGVFPAALGVLDSEEWEGIEGIRARRRQRADSAPGAARPTPTSATTSTSTARRRRRRRRRRTIGKDPSLTSTTPRTGSGTPKLDDPLTEALVRTRRFFTRAEISDDLRTLHQVGGREADDFYRDRWSHDKVVRSTHGVNCTGSCSWKVYVKDGIITWETQQTDYPSVGPGLARSTSPAAAPAAPRSPGTPTRRPGSATPTCAASCCRCSARPRPSTTATRSLAWAHIVDDPERAKALQVRPRQGRPGPRHLGRGHRDRRRRPRPHDQEVRARTGSPASRRSRRCRWSRTPPAPGS